MYVYEHTYNNLKSTLENAQGTAVPDFPLTPRRNKLGERATLIQIGDDESQHNGLVIDRNRMG